MPIAGSGWELHVDRLGLQASGGRTRTYGRYQVYRDGVAVAGLGGNVCESPGPGANAPAGNGKRVQAGRYPLWTQFGRYRSIGYSASHDEATALASMPGLLLGATGKRVGILIHPGHPPTLYLSSIGCLNLTAPLGPGQQMNFLESRDRVIALIDNLRAFAPTAFAHETSTAIPDATVVIDGEPLTPMADPLAASLQSTMAAPASLPISPAQATACATWLMDNFAAPIRAAVTGKTYGASHLAGIVCQETAYKWLKWTGAQSVGDILARCVFDASGDYPGTSRSAFPVDTAAFRAAYGEAFTDMLIEEANRTRRLQNWGDQAWVYKGYGIFQYDLQSVKTDRTFFEEKLWYDFDECLNRCCGELDRKLANPKIAGDLWKAIKAYNGSGAKATQYAENVRAFTAYCLPVTG